MPVDIVMPRLSDTMTEGTVARWLKKPGEAIARGEAIAEIETDKALMQYESFEAGTLGEIKVPDGQTVPLGTTIAVMYRAGEKAESAAAPATTTDKAPASAGQAPTQAPAAEAAPVPASERENTGRASADQTEQASNGGRVRASPLARRVAAERGVDLAGVQGSGPGGRIVRADVEANA